MKKLIMLTLSSFILVLSSCSSYYRTTTRVVFAMDAPITLRATINNSSSTNVTEVFNQITDLLNDYHRLSDMFNSFEGINNVYTINYASRSNCHYWIEVDSRLYNMLYAAYNFTDDDRFNSISQVPFNILIGSISQLWKDSFSERMPYSIPQYVLDYHLKIMNNSTLHFHEEYYKVKLIGGAQIDLGAFAKGYVVQRGYEVFRNHNIRFFSIDGGRSSIHMGQNYYRDSRYFHVGISDPNRLIGRDLGLIHLQNTSITTSGSETQRATIDDYLYSHKINPATGSARVGYFSSVSIISDDTVIPEILTTIFFFLSKEDILAFYQLFDIYIILIDNDSNIVYYSEGVVIHR